MSDYFEYLASPGEYTNYQKWLCFALCLLLGLVLSFFLIFYCAFLLYFSYLLAGLAMLLSLLLFRSLSARTEVEFEYCVAEESLQIDRIFARRFRKPFDSLELKRITEIQAYDPAHGERVSGIVWAAPKAREDLFSVFYREEGQGEPCLLVLALDASALARLRSACPRARR